MSAGGNELIERTFQFARSVRRLVNRIPQTPATREDIKQLIRSSGSVASNYLEAQEGLSRKDFFYRIKVCRKEARESALWLRLIEVDPRSDTYEAKDRLLDEALQLTKIFSAIASRDDTSD